MSFFHQPKKLWIISFGTIWDTFSYYGTQTILALYLIKIFHTEQHTSYLIYGAYAAIAFSSPVFGGVIADKWLGSKLTMMTGCLLNIIGNLFLVSFNPYLFSLGLSTALIGSGLFKSNATHLVGTLYQQGHFKKEQGFTLLYIATNIGGTLGPLIYGLVAYSLGWNYAFIGSALGLLISGLLLLSHWRTIDSHEVTTMSITKEKLFIFFPGIVAFCVILSFLFYFPNSINPVICSLFAIGLLYLIAATRRYQAKERQRLIALLLLCFFAMFYFAAGLQIGTTITLFIQQKIQQGVLQLKLPASTFNMLYPLFVLLLAPCFTALWARLKSKGNEINITSKLILGISLAAFGISAFALATISNHLIIVIVTGYLFLSAGELVITPAAYTAISDLSPAGIKSTMMGAWLLFIAIGGYLSSLLASASHMVAEKLPMIHQDYLGEFLFIALFTFSVAIIVALAKPKLSKMISQ